MAEFLTGAYTDCGIWRKVNQDSVFLEEAVTETGPVLLAAVCDGMGGLTRGEEASAEMVRALERWFEKELAELLRKKGRVLSFSEFKYQMDLLIRTTGKNISGSMEEKSGTTLCGLYCCDGIYYTVNVGDSRGYMRTNGILIQLTKDQTLVQQELDKGKLTKEEARNHPKRSVLLQCVGASDTVVPVYTRGFYTEGDCFLLCSDGFSHEIEEQEIVEALEISGKPSEKQLEELLMELAERIRERGEKDNISALLICSAGT